MAHQVPARLTSRELRRFGVTVGGAFLAFAGLSRWRGHDTVPLVLAGLGATLVLLGIATPGALQPVFHWWMGLARVLSKVTTPIFMGIVYFLLITPVGLVRRSLGTTPLRRPARNGSFWVEHESSSEQSMTQQF